MAPKSSRRTRPARQLPSDPANLPVVSADVWEIIFSFMLRIHRLPLLCVCKAWREAGLADADLWRFLVVTCESVTVNVAAMAPQRRLPHIHGEYTPSRAVLEGALPVTLRQLTGLPHPSFVREIIFARDWAALPDIKEDEAWFEQMEVLLGKLPALPQLRKLRVPLFFLHSPAMAALATWMRGLSTLEFLDIPLDDDDEGFALWAETWRSGVVEPNSRLRSRKIRWEWADDLPKLFPNLRGISRLWAHQVSPATVRRWPAEFRAQLEVLEVEQGEQHGWSHADVWTLKELFPSLRRLLFSWHEFDDASPEWASLLLSLCQGPPPHTVTPVTPVTPLHPLHS